MRYHGRLTKPLISTYSSAAPSLIQPATQWPTTMADMIAPGGPPPGGAHPVTVPAEDKPKPVKPVAYITKSRRAAIAANAAVKAKKAAAEAAKNPIWRATSLPAGLNAAELIAATAAEMEGYLLEANHPSHKAPAAIPSLYTAPVPQPAATKGKLSPRKPLPAFSTHKTFHPPPSTRKVPLSGTTSTDLKTPGPSVRSPNASTKAPIPPNLPSTPSPAPGALPLQPKPSGLAGMLSDLLAPSHRSSVADDVDGEDADSVDASAPSPAARRLSKAEMLARLADKGPSLNPHNVLTSLCGCHGLPSAPRFSPEVWCLDVWSVLAGDVWQQRVWTVGVAPTPLPPPPKPLLASATPSPPPPGGKSGKPRSASRGGRESSSTSPSPDGRFTFLSPVGDGSKSGEDGDESLFGAPTLAASPKSRSSRRGSAARSRAASSVGGVTGMLGAGGEDVETDDEESDDEEEKEYELFTCSQPLALLSGIKFMGISAGGV